MSPQSSPTDQLSTLNQIAETLNRSVDVRSALNASLAHLVELMGLETGWIFLRDPAAQEIWAGRGYVLIAHRNLPPALALDNSDIWQGGCDCQGLCNKGRLERAYNEVRCSRLASASGDRRGLVVHASTPLTSNERILGILNVAGPDWSDFSASALALLTNVGNQMGIALERARLFDLLRERHTEEQAALLELSNQLLGRLDLDDLMTYLVEAVRRLLKADGCALLLPDPESDQLAFRATSGWHIDPVAKRRRVPADKRSGPGLVIHTQQPLLVEDLEKSDPPPWRRSWLDEEGFHGHAVMPLIAEGNSVGVLVIDTKQPRLLNEDEVRFLRLMANQAAIAIEKARLHQEELKRQRLQEELAIARKIQLSLLPEACPDVPGWDFAVFYQAARQVGGDFYDFIELPDKANQMGLVIADVAGKGIPAALLVALSRTMIRTAALSGLGPSAALTQANEFILKESKVRRFVTAFYAALDTANGQLVYANAGHNQPLWLQAATGQVDELTAQGAVLGMFETVDLEERSIDLSPGDMVLFHTDGVTEAMDPNRQMFGEVRLKKVFAANQETSASQLLEAVVNEVRHFGSGTAQSDDLTLLVVKRRNNG